MLAYFYMCRCKCLPLDYGNYTFALALPHLGDKPRERKERNAESHPVIKVAPRVNPRGTSAPKIAATFSFCPHSSGTNISCRRQVSYFRGCGAARRCALAAFAEGGRKASGWRDDEGQGGPEDRGGCKVGGNGIQPPRASRSPDNGVAAGTFKSK
jgi:hypothetical protein